MSIKIINKDYLSSQIKNFHDSSIEPKLSKIEKSVSILNGDANTEGSIQHTVTSAIAKVVDEAPASFDTLKEISDWIGDHETDALNMNSSILSNKNSIILLNSDKNVLGSVDNKISTAFENLEAETDNIDFETELNTEKFNLEIATVSIKTGISYRYKMENDTLYLPLALWEKQYKTNYANYIKVNFTSDVSNSRYRPYTEMVDCFYEDGSTDYYTDTPLVDLSYTTSDSSMKVMKNVGGMTLITPNGFDYEGNYVYKVGFNLQFYINTRNESMIGKWFEFNLTTTKPTSKYYGKSKTFKVIITGDQL